MALCADGVNSFHRERIAHSMWPITMSVLNLPRHVCHLFRSLMLVGIVPGPHKPKNMDTYLNPVINEILHLTNARLFDVVSNAHFRLRLKVCLSVLDYPGQNKVFKFSGANAYSGCGQCQLTGEWSAALRKVIYLGSRRFLSPSDYFRKDKNTFPEQCITSTSSGRQDHGIH